MISLLQPLAAGNAVRVIVQPPDGANCWRVLRNLTGVFAGPGDPAATVVAARSSETSILDLTGLTNDVEYFYRDFTSADGGNSWVDSGVSLAATPSTSYFDPTPDPQELVRDRILLGLAAAVTRGELIPETGAIPVFIAPFAVADGVTFPCVSVHLNSSASGERAIGEDMSGDVSDLDGNAEMTAGWLARVSMKIVGVSLNPDERLQLRKVLRRVVQSNLPVFDDAGMVQITFSQTDMEQFSENNAPLYITDGAFDCLAPTLIVERDPYLTEIVLDTGGMSAVSLGVDDLPGIDIEVVEETIPLSEKFNITAYGDPVA